MATKLVGDEHEDQKIICQWFATSYGEVNQAYHEAYSREILRQIREQLNSADSTKPKASSWIG